MKIFNYGRKQIAVLLEDCGYSASDLISAEYSHTNDRNQAVFDIVYDQLGEGFQEGKVYVYIQDGQLSAEY